MSERITLAEAARRSRHTPVALRQAAQRGVLRAEKVGEGNRATWYTTPADLDAYLAQRHTWRGYAGRPPAEGAEQGMESGYTETAFEGSEGTDDEDDTTGE